MGKPRHPSVLYASFPIATIATTTQTHQIEAPPAGDGIVTLWCIIPARGGSRRIPGKNLRPFFGRPILGYTLALAKPLFDRLVVSTDNETIANFARASGVEVHRRSSADAQDKVGTLQVTRNAAAALGVGPQDLVCCIYPCAGPFALADDIAQGEALVTGGALATISHASPSISHAFAVGTNPLSDAGQWYWSTAGALRQGAALIGISTRLVPIPGHRVCDINTESDWRAAEALYLSWKEETIEPASESMGD